MADNEILENVEFRVVRDQDAGYYMLQANYGGVWRTVHIHKLGKIDQLRAQLAAEQQSQTPPTTQG